MAELVLGLERAAGDPRVPASWRWSTARRHGFAVAQELRDAVKAFRASAVRARLERQPGRAGPADEGYYLATAFDEISVQPAGLVGVSRLRDRDALPPRTCWTAWASALSVAARRLQDGARDLHRERPTPANQAMLQDLVDQPWQGLVAGVAEGAAPAGRAGGGGCLGAGPLHRGRGAATPGSSTGLAYRDEVEASGTGPSRCRRPPRAVAEYLSRTRRARRRRHDRGLRARRGRHPARRRRLGGGVAADDLARALTEAIDDPAAARSCSGSPPRAARRSPPRPSPIRCARPSRSASRSSSRWAMSRPRAATGSRWTRPASSPSR